MNSLKRIVSDWFGYSRRERRASMILVIIIIVVILARFIIPEKEIDIEVNTLMPPAPAEEYIAAGKASIEQVSLFRFDPNSASFSDLTSLGIPGKVAGTLIRYRNSGARFRKPEDIMKVYGMDTMLARSIIPYIYIEEPDSIFVRKTIVHESASSSSSSRDLMVMAMVDINRCDSASLEALPGIGPVLSARIIKFRELLGGYVSFEQLKEVYGLSDSVYQVILKLVRIDSLAVRRININSAGFRELERHPYIERYEAQSIIKFREVNGNIRNLSELTSNGILSEAKAKRISRYFSF
jgi:competence protein ComEA